MRQWFGERPLRGRRQRRRRRLSTSRPGRCGVEVSVIRRSGGVVAGGSNCCCIVAARKVKLYLRIIERGAAVSGQFNPRCITLAWPNVGAAGTLVSCGRHVVGQSASAADVSAGQVVVADLNSAIDLDAVQWRRACRWCCRLQLPAFRSWTAGCSRVGIVRHAAIFADFNVNAELVHLVDCVARDERSVDAGVAA